MASIIDTLGLSELVGSTTFLRGYSYAQQGRVSAVQWLEKPDRLYGHIMGSRSQPYAALVTVTEDWDGAITSLDGHCTCPMGQDCKHAVALVLVGYDEVTPVRTPASSASTGAASSTALAAAKPALAGNPGTPARPGTPGRPAPPAPWERSFAALLGAGDPEPHRQWAPVALQFELMDGKNSAQRAGGSTPGPRGPSPALRLGVRPVVIGNKGKWVRTGISWSSLGYGSYQYGRTYNPEHLRLLSELASLSSTGGDYYYRQNPWVYLDALGSRRIWNLLDDAQASGLPLVRADKVQSSVPLIEQPASVALDIARSGAELVVTPVVDLGHRAEARTGLEPQAPNRENAEPGQRLQLLGSPPHGLVLWPASVSPTVNPKDYPWSLARLDKPVPPELASFLGGGHSPGQLRIPAQDEPRFLRDYYPRLRQRVALVSRDRSFELPEDDKPTLVLTVSHLPDHQVDLRWEWAYGAEDVPRLEPLWLDGDDTPYGMDTLWGGGAAHRDLVFERKIVESLELDPDDATQLMQDTVRGRRLAPTTRLRGLDTVEFLMRTLPRLTGLEHLAVRVDGSGTAYRPADEDPVVAIASTQSADDRDWFDLAITVSVDGEQVPFQDIFTALAQDQSHLILPSGTYFPLDGRVFLELKTLIEEARALQDAPERGLRINRYQTSLWDDLDKLGVVSAQASAWKQAVAALQDHDLMTTQPAPATLKATLRAYQQVGFSWLTFLFDHRLGGVLADDMGLGKTIQTLALICHVQESRGLEEAAVGGSDTACPREADGVAARPSPFLVVAPTSVVTNWVSECRRFAPDLNVVAVHETHARRGVELAQLHAGMDIVITSYALFRLEFDDYESLPWTGLILDEAQAIKNHLAKTHQCARRLPTDFKLAITGTPMENNLMELWSMFSITAPGLFPYPTRFVDYYQRPIEKEDSTDRLAQLRRRIRPFMLRRTKEQVVTDLPPKQEHVLELEMHPRHKRVYETHLQRERQKVLGMIHDLDKNRFAIFRSLMLLRQISLDASLVDPKYDNVPSTKLDALMLQLEDITAGGHRVLVFSQFTGFLDRARRRLEAEKIRYCYLDGKTRNRTKVIEEFRSGDAPVFLISLKAGGVGLNLTEADYCIILDPWWNPATEAQAVDRTHRIGQTKKVTVYRLVSKDTIEEKVMALKAAKAKLFDAVLADNGAAGQRALSAAEIRGLLD